MQKNIYANILAIGVAAVVFGARIACADGCGSSIVMPAVWEGPLTPSVVDEDLFIKSSLGDVILSGSVSIKAVNKDVTIFLCGDARIDGGSNNPRLYLEAGNGRTITFKVSHDLDFASTQEAFSIFARSGNAGTPGGNVVFQFTGGSCLSFGGVHGSASAPVQFYKIMDGTHVSFVRSPDESEQDRAQDVFVEIGHNAFVGYASPWDAGVGAHDRSYLFDPSNPGPGRFGLKIGNKGAFVVSGRFIGDPYSCDTTGADVNRGKLAGGSALLEIVSTRSGACAGFTVINGNATFSDFTQWNNNADGVQYGWILGANGVLRVGSGAYCDYIALCLDESPTFNVSPSSESSLADSCCQNLSGSTGSYIPLSDLPIRSIMKKRNASAFVVDGFCNCVGALPARVELADRSALFFRSGGDKDGCRESDEDVCYPWTIDPSKRARGLGNMVLDVEGLFVIVGSGTDRLNNPTKVEILSLYVEPTGGSVLIGGTQTEFPRRTFARDSKGRLRSYAPAYALINNEMTLCNTWLVHTDQNHAIYEKDDVASEPTYIGGDAIKLSLSPERPRIVFSNATFMVHTNVAFTGVDLAIPEGVVCDGDALTSYPDFCSTGTAHAFLAPERHCDNESNFIFFFNGYDIDNGTGRQMVLGTHVGSNAAGKIISRDSFLDIFPRSVVTNFPLRSTPLVEKLRLTTEANDSTIIEDAPIDPVAIEGENSVHTVFLGHASNISIGLQGLKAPPDVVSNPTLSIDGDTFSFVARGGVMNSPEASCVTGQGGIFVDYGGKIEVGPRVCSVNMGVAVTKSSSTGIVSLPGPIVRFAPRVGVADWKLNLNENNVIINPGSKLSDYTFNWLTAIKATGFVPYVPHNCDACHALPALAANLIGLPTISSAIDQLNIAGSRIGDPAHILVGKGGFVRELVFLNGYNSADAATAVVVLEAGGTFGLGSIHTSIDSLCSPVALGLHGITIVANGDGRVLLNEDAVINNVCHLVPGPGFADGGRLLITSASCRTIRVKSSGVLDLSAFSGLHAADQIIELGGSVRLVLEPGAKIVMGGCTLRFSDAAGLVCEPASPIAVLSSQSGYDDLRVQCMGRGTLEFTDCSFMSVPLNAFVGIEAQRDCVEATNLAFVLEGNARVSIGGPCGPGGAFQIGNTFSGGDVSFSLTINGSGAEFIIGEQGFVGLGAGIRTKGASDTETLNGNWYVSTTSDVKDISITVGKGTFTHNCIFSGSSTRASVLALGTGVGNFAVVLGGGTNSSTANTGPAGLRGGGNLVRVSSSTPAKLSITDTATNSVAMVASLALYKNIVSSTGAASAIFNFLKMDDVAGSDIKYNSRGVVGPFENHSVVVGYVDGNFLQRVPWITIAGGGGITTAQTHSLDVGAAALTLLKDATKPRGLKSVSVIG